MTVHNFFAERRPHNGLTYDEYWKNFEDELKNKNEASQSEFKKLNYQRSSRIHKTYTINESLRAKISNINTPQIWMVITENWCGDSAQNLPYIAEFAKCNTLIDLRILLRDQNLDIMDLYLTDGKSRSIPKLIAFDLKGNELFQWGPRPKEAQELIRSAKLQGKQKEEFMKDLHSWYANDKGKSIEEELFDLILKTIHS